VRIAGSARRNVALLGLAAGVTLAATLVATNAGATSDKAPAGAAAAAPDRGLAELARVNGVAERQTRQTTIASALLSRLGDRAGGAWLDASGNAVVNVLDSRSAAAVRAAGAQARLVTHSLRQLSSTQSWMNRNGSAVGTITAIDPATDQVVVTLTDSVSAKDAAKVRRAAARWGSQVRVEKTAGVLSTFAQGGDAILTGGARCSLGFNVHLSSGANFATTAGHCTNIGTNWTAAGRTLGTTAASSFPSDDFGVIRLAAGVAAPGTVNLYNGSSQRITGAATPAAGSQVCRSGSTTGVHCGTIQRLNATVRYAEGTVTGLIQTNVCAEPGDSGGSLFAGSTAVGMTSGGSGNCSQGGQTFFQPVTEVLQRFGLLINTA
jgi:streptogrisin D